jgi:hypothetical protein
MGSHWVISETEEASKEKAPKGVFSLTGDSRVWETLRRESKRLPDILKF